MPPKVDTEKQFYQRLLTEAAQRPVSEARLIQWVHSGHCPRRVLRGMAASILAGAAQFPPRLSALYQIATDPGVRLHILSNLLEECGIVPDAQHTLVACPEQRHVNWAITFAHACGLTEGQITACVTRPSAVYPAVDQAIAAGDWQYAWAYLACLEFNVSRSYPFLIAGLLKSGFTAADIVFLSNHVTADAEHGQAGMMLVAQVSTGEEARARALQAVQSAARHWWELYQGTGDSRRTRG